MSDGAKIAACWAVACLLAVGFLQLSGAADITPGYTFTPAEKNITDVKLNAAASGTVATSFYTGKSADTAVGADTLLFYSSSAGTYKKTTLTTLFGNAPAINGLSTMNSVGNFSVATSKFTVAAADGAVAWLGKLTASSNAVVTATNNGPLLALTNYSSGGSAVGLSIDGQNGTIGNALKVYGGATFSGVSAFSNNVTFYASASIGSQLSVTNSLLTYGSVVLGDAAADTVTLNGTLAGTLYGAPVVALTNATPLTTDKFLFQASGDSSKLRIGTLPTTTTTFTTNVALAVGVVFDGAHGLGGVPTTTQAWLKCLTANNGYSVGDYVEIYTAGFTSYSACALIGKNATNVFVAMDPAACYLMNKATAARTAAITVGNWEMVIQATRTP